jgi:hypothetical protein
LLFLLDLLEYDAPFKKVETFVKRMFPVEFVAHSFKSLKAEVKFLISTQVLLTSHPVGDR